MLKGLRGIGFVYPLSYRYWEIQHVLSSRNRTDPEQLGDSRGSVESHCRGNQHHLPTQPRTSIKQPRLMQQLHPLQERKKEKKKKFIHNDFLEARLKLGIFHENRIIRKIIFNSSICLVQRSKQTL
uniref:Uncharacterized protein n=1 Tax=Cucumis melo TaxID=3656 RepID=A0A9I9E8W4_CUCME